MARSIRVWNHPMDRSPLRMASDYNRGLCPEARAVHVVAAWFRVVTAPLVAWSRRGGAARRVWAIPLLIAAILFLLVYPLDGPLSRWMRGWPLAGDIKRELTAWQQYGALTSIVVVALIVVLLDQARWRRVFDLIAASVLTVLACNLMKMVVGRPRPVLEDPRTFLWPWGMYPVPVSDASARGGGGARMVLTHAWGSPRSVGYELWSMPSSHTAAAVVLSVFLCVMYPRLKPLAIALVVLVGLTRVITGAHWPTDVIVGAILGYAIASLCIREFWGMRAMDWAWRKVVDPNAAPTALPLRESK